MDAFELNEIVEQHASRGERYYEFFRDSALSLGLFVLRVGETDTQLPHTEDEVYYVIQGNGTIQVGGEDRPVTTGSTVYVGRGVDHRFHSITEDLTMMVFWAPPLRSQAASA
jgi:mannose-6-phosphate isomerase-like protein (cupin superfamily)